MSLLQDPHSQKGRKKIQAAARNIGNCQEAEKQIRESDKFRTERPAAARGARQGKRKE